MKNLLFIAIIGLIFWSCGDDDDQPVNSAPSTPTTIYPANNELCIDNNVNFRWNASTDADGGIITYTIEVSTNSSFSPISQSRTTTSTSEVINLEKGVSFYWRVRAKDSENAASNNSTANEFYTESLGSSNYIPFSPVLVEPSLNATIQGATTNLQWTASDVDNDPLKYDVYLDTNPDPTTIVSSNQDATNFTTPTLTATTTYFWKIVVKDDKGGETIGQVWTFKTD